MLTLPKLNWRDQLYEDEAAENFHFLLFADQNNIYYYDPFIDGYPIRPLATGFLNI